MANCLFAAACNLFIKDWKKDIVDFKPHTFNPPRPCWVWYINI
jgi:hypothetical protein